MIIPKLITRGELTHLKIPAVYKNAIDTAIDNWLAQEPIELQDAFRGEVVEMLKALAMSKSDSPEYDTEATWFMAGWQAKERDQEAQ